MIRWAFLNSDEKSKLESYDESLVRLMAEKTYSKNEELDKKIKELHTSMDLFILQLQDKYDKK